MLTDTAIKRAIRAGKPCQLSEGSGRNKGRLVLKIRPPLAEWYVQQWTNGKRTFRKLGAFPGMGLDAARDAFQGYGHDIRVGTIVKPIETPKAGTVGELVAAYLTSLEGRPSHAVASYELNRFVAHVGKHKAAHAVTKDHVIDFLRPIYARGKASMADHLRAYIKAAFKAAIEAESDYRSAVTKRFGLRSNPAADIPAERRNPGKRWLTPDELRAFWQWLDSEDASQLTPWYCAAVKLHIVTGQRMTEIVKINARSVNRMLGVIEWEWTKIGNDHVIPLPSQGWEILNGLTPNEHGLYFPSVERPSESVSPSMLSEIRRKFISRTGAAEFESRDIRRTWKTLAGFAKLTKEDRDRIQNHRSGDVSSKHYDRYDYLDEKKEAMKRWSEWFRMNVESEPQKVIEMKKPLG